MRSKESLRRHERLLALLAWLWFVAGTLGVLGLCAAALLAERAPAPEAFLVDLAMLLAAMLGPVFVLRGLVAMCRRERTRLRRAETAIFAGRPFEDSSTTISG